MECLHQSEVCARQVPAKLGSMLEANYWRSSIAKLDLTIFALNFGAIVHLISKCTVIAVEKHQACSREANS